MPSHTMQPLASRFPFIETFSQEVSSQERSGQRASTLTSAKVLVNLCGNVRRDLAYVSRLQEDVDEKLRSCSQYHTNWIQEVRRDASQALLDLNSYLGHKMPASKGGDAPLKIVRVMKNSRKMASLERELSSAHAGLLGIIGFMQMLGLKSGKLLLEPTQDVAELQTVSPVVE